MFYKIAFRIAKTAKNPFLETKKSIPHSGAAIPESRRPISKTVEKSALFH